MVDRNRRPARTRVKKIDLLTRSRMLDNVGQTHLSENDVNIAQQNAAFKLPKRLPITPADSLHLCILKLMSDGDEYSVDELVNLASKITPNIDAVPKIVLEFFQNNLLTDRKELETGKTVYYYTLNEQGKEHMNTLINGAKDSERVSAEPTTEEIDQAIWTTMLDYKKRTAEELINVVSAQSGIPRGLVDQRFHNIFRRVEIVRNGKGKTTTYTLRKGETMEKLLRKNLPTVGTVRPETLAGLGEKYVLKVAAPKKSEEAPTIKYRKLSAEERTIKKDDTLANMIWRTMYGNGFLTIVEVALILKDHGKSETAVRNSFNDLINQDWFTIELRGKRKIRHFAIHAHIDPAKVAEKEQPLIATPAPEVKDDRPYIWVADLASNIGIDLASVVRMLPDYGQQAVATQMIPAAVADKIRENIDPDQLLAGMSMNELAKELDVPLVLLIDVQNKLNPGCSLTVGSVKRLRECEELKLARGTAVLSDLARELGVTDYRLINYLKRKGVMEYGASSTLPATLVKEIKEAVAEEAARFDTPDDATLVSLTQLALELKVPAAKVVKWMKLNRHTIDIHNQVSKAAADALREKRWQLDDVEGAIVVGDLALELGVTPADVISAASKFGQLVTISQVLAKEFADEIRKSLVSTTSLLDLSKELGLPIHEIVAAHCDINNRGRISIRSDDVLNHRELAKLRTYLGTVKSFKGEQSPSLRVSANEARARLEYQKTAAKASDEAQEMREIGLTPHASVQSTGLVPIKSVPKPLTVVEEVSQMWDGTEPPKRRSFLKVKIHLFGMDLIPEDAKALALKLKAMGMATEEGRQALTTTSLLDITFKIGDEVLDIKELHDLYQELDEAGFCDE